MTPADLHRIRSGWAPMLTLERPCYLPEVERATRALVVWTFWRRAGGGV